jgi:hypothetical protein
VLLALATYDFDKQAMTSPWRQIEGFETSLEVDNSEKIGDIYSRLGIMNAEMKALKLRVDDYEPYIKAMRDREAQTKQDAQKATENLNKDVNQIMTDNMSMTGQMAQEQVANQEKELIKSQAKALMTEQAVEGFDNSDPYAFMEPVTPMGKAGKKFLEDATQDMYSSDRDFIAGVVREEGMGSL